MAHHFKNVQRWMKAQHFVQGRCSGGINRWRTGTEDPVGLATCHCRVGVVSWAGVARAPAAGAACGGRLFQRSRRSPHSFARMNEWRSARAPKINWNLHADVLTNGKLLINGFLLLFNLGPHHKRIWLRLAIWFLRRTWLSIYLLIGIDWLCNLSQSWRFIYVWVFILWTS